MRLGACCENVVIAQGNKDKVEKPKRAFPSERVLLFLGSQKGYTVEDIVTGKRGA